MPCHDPRVGELWERWGRVATAFVLLVLAGLWALLQPEVWLWKFAVAVMAVQFGVVLVADLRKPPGS